MHNRRVLRQIISNARHKGSPVILSEAKNLVGSAPVGKLILRFAQNDNSPFHLPLGQFTVTDLRAANFTPCRSGFQTRSYSSSVRRSKYALGPGCTLCLEI